MQFKIVRMNLLLGVQLSQPYLLLAKNAPEIFDEFYKALSPRHRINLGDMQIAAGNNFDDLKLSIALYQGKGKIDIFPSAMIADMRDLVKSNDDLTAAKDHFTTCEETFLKALNFKDHIISNVARRDFRAYLWIECPEGKDAALKWLRSHGDKGFNLKTDAFTGMIRDYNLQVRFQNSSDGTGFGVGIENSQLEIGHLYLSCENYILSKGYVSPLGRQFDDAQQSILALLSQIGLEPINGV